MLLCCGLACASLPRDSISGLNYTALVNRWGHVLDGYSYTQDTPNGTARYNETFGYGYDKSGSVSSRTNGALVQTFNASGLNFLTNITRNSTLTAAGSLSATASSMTVNGQAAAVYKDQTFATTSGLTLTNGVNTFVYTAKDALRHPSTKTIVVTLPQSINCSYDDNGNLLSDGVRSFVYDDANRLTQMYVTNNWRTDFVYDGVSRKRIRKDYSGSGSSWTQTNETHYIYAGMDVIQERSSNNVPLVTYTRGVGLLARTDAGGPLYYHTDGNNNVTSMVDGNGNLKARYTYDSYGNLIAKIGPMADVNLYRWSSKETHTLGGIYYYGYRFYDPNLQRWLNKDPIGLAGGRNMYAFVGNNPISRVDPFGQQAAVQLELDLDIELIEPQPIRWGPGLMPEDEVLRARDDLLRRGAPSDMALSQAEPEPASGDTWLSRLLSALGNLFKKCADTRRAGPLPSGEAPYQLKVFPDEAYNRVQHYGRTPTAEQRGSVPAGMEFDHNPTLVEHYYEGVNGGLPGFNLTEAERLDQTQSLTSGGAATPAEQRAQGAGAAAYLRAQKRLWGLE